MPSFGRSASTGKPAKTYSLRALLWLLIAAICLPIGAILSYNLWAEIQESTDLGLEQLKFEAGTAAQRNGQLLTELKGRLVAYSERPKVQKLDPADCDSSIGSELLTHLKLANAFTLDAEGKLICSAVPLAAGRPSQVDPRYYLNELRRTRAFTIGTPAKGFVTGRWVVTLAQPVLGADGEVKGAVAFSLDLLNFWSGSSALALDAPYGGRSRIIDDRGMIVASSEEPEQSVGKNARGSYFDFILAHRHGVLREHDRSGVDRFYAFAEIPGTPWYLSTGVPTANVLAQSRHSIRRIEIVSVCVIALVLAMAWFFSRRIVDPVKSMAARFVDVANGKTWVRAEPSGPIEVAQMALEFNRMLDQIERHRIAIESSERERRNAEEEWYRAAREFQDLYDHAPCGYHSLDAQGRFLQINETELAWLGYTRDELIGKLRLSDLTDDEGRAVFAAGFARFMESGSVSDLELRLRNKEGSEFTVLVNATAVYDKAGQFVKSRSTLTDISARKRAEQALIEAKRVAEEASQTKSRFLANVSHELRTPLNSMIGLTGVVLAKEKDPLLYSHLERIQVAGNVLLGVLTEILDHSKMEAGLMQLESLPLRTAALFDKSKALFQVRAVEKDLELSFAVAPDLPPVLLGDGLRLQQAIGNLVGNALKFTERGSVQVWAECAQRSADSVLLKVSVRDTGIGLTSEQTRRLFQAFQQADTSITRKYGGSGLGLSIVKSLAELMGGQVGVESQEGKGSTFWFTARMAVADEAEAGNEASRSIVAPLQPPLAEGAAAEGNRPVDEEALVAQLRELVGQLASGQVRARQSSARIEAMLAGSPLQGSFGPIARAIAGFDFKRARDQLTDLAMQKDWRL